MHVAVQHRITDPEKFFSSDPQEIAENAPSGVTAGQFFPSKDRSAAVCLWEGDSIDAVRGYVDSITADSSQNTYFEVDPEYATGRPEAVAATA